MKITKNFRLAEFTNSKTAKENKINNTPSHQIIIDNITALCVNILQPLRDAVNKSITINSGYRCLKLNKLVGGVPTSQHVQGQACDFVVDDMTPYEIAKMIIELDLPFDQLILYPTFVHVSYSDRHRRNLLYNKTYKGDKNLKVCKHIQLIDLE